MDTQKKTISIKKATVEWVLCSLHFKQYYSDSIQGLNDTPFTPQYQEIPVKHSRKKYFEVEWPNALCKRKGHYITL